MRNIKEYLLGTATEDGVPVEAIMDFMAHFYLLPDYNYAKNLGLLTPDDIKLLDIFDFMTEIFQQSDFLKKGGDGRYTWVGDPQTLKRAWFTVASSLDLYKSYSQ